MSHDHPHGKPENVLEFTENDDKVVIIDAPLKNIFEHPDVKNRKIVAFSIIGAYRKGKSFFLDYCLRYLYANYKSINYPTNPISSSNDWMSESDTPLQGFSWRAGSSRDTTGIVIWNDAFLHTIPNTGEKIAIVVMDTQGLFDNETSPMDNSRIFALGTLISSIQVLNLVGNVQEDQLQYLQFATEFAKFVAIDSKGTVEKPFQNMMFLIRDWANPDDYSFGIDGGKKYLENFLKIIPKQAVVLKSVRKFIHNSFEELSCALLPNPGKIVSGGKKLKQQYDGNWGQMDEDFKEELEKLIEHLLSPDRLVIKKINSSDLKGSEFKEYVNQYFKLFQSDELPQAQSIYETTIEKQMNILINACLEMYKKSIFKYEAMIKCVDEITAFHKLSRFEAIEHFNNAKKMGTAEHEIKFKELLGVKFEEFYAEWSDRSEKNIKKLNEEREKARIAEVESLLQQKLMEHEAAEKLAELERLKDAKGIEKAEYEKQKAIADERLKHELKRRAEMEEQKKREETLRKELQNNQTLIEDERSEIIDVFNPIHSEDDQFKVTFRFLAWNYITLQLTLTSAKGMAKALNSLPAIQFRTYLFNLFDSVKKFDNTAGSGIEHADKENIYEKITIGSCEFQSKVEEFERNSGMYKYIYVNGIRSHSYSQLTNVFAFKERGKVELWANPMWIKNLRN